MRRSLLAILLAGCAHAPPPACPTTHAGHGWSAGLMHGSPPRTQAELEAYCARSQQLCEAHGMAGEHRHPGDGAESAANAHMHAMDFAQLVARFEDPARDAWQKPAALVASLGAQGKVVADLGAGTGYFAVRLLEVAQRVIATDVDERFLAYLRGRASMLPPATRDRLVLRRVGTDRPGLVPEEADLALIVDVYHHVEDRPAWLKALAAGLRPGGEVVVVDFKPGDLPDAPPPALRVPAATVVEELEAAGFEAPRVDDALLPRQYVVRARVAASP